MSSLRKIVDSVEIDPEQARAALHENISCLDFESGDRALAILKFASLLSLLGDPSQLQQWHESIQVHEDKHAYRISKWIEQECTHLIDLVTSATGIMEGGEALGEERERLVSSALVDAQDMVCIARANETWSGLDIVRVDLDDMESACNQMLDVIDRNLPSLAPLSSYHSLYSLPQDTRLGKHDLSSGLRMVVDDERLNSLVAGFIGSQAVRSAAAVVGLATTALHFADGATPASASRALLEEWKRNPIHISKDIDGVHHEMNLVMRDNWKLHVDLRRTGEDGDSVSPLRVRLGSLKGVQEAKHRFVFDLSELSLDDQVRLSRTRPVITFDDD